MNDNLKLWGRATSVNVQKVAWLIAELELDCDRIDAGGAFGGLDDKRYLALNPNKKVPTLIDGTFVLWESNAICRYLVNKYGSYSPLKDANFTKQAQADMWMEWFQNNVYSNFIALFYQAVRLPPSQRSLEKRDTALQAVNSALALFDDALETKKFVCGNVLSVGDIPTGSCLHRYFTMEIKRPAFSNLERYYEDLKIRKTYQDHVMVDYSSLRGSD
ncbi:MAG: glutathione S-transferase N-terminal domain-containing protein [Lentilitoribacter sp.]